MRIVKRFITNSLLVASCLATLGGGLTPVMASAQANASQPTAMVASSVSDACAGIGLAGGDCNKGSGGAASGVNNVVITVVNILSTVVGIAAVIMIIISGFKYITSGGDSNAVSAAKSGIIYAIVGLIVVALAQTLVHFVIKSVA